MPMDAQLREIVSESIQLTALLEQLRTLRDVARTAGHGHYSLVAAVGDQVLFKLINDAGRLELSQPGGFAKPIDNLRLGSLIFRAAVLDLMASDLRQLIRSTKADVMAWQAKHHASMQALIRAFDQMAGWSVPDGPRRAPSGAIDAYVDVRELVKSAKRLVPVTRSNVSRTLAATGVPLTDVAAVVGGNKRSYGTRYSAWRRFGAPAWGAGLAPKFGADELDAMSHILQIPSELRCMAINSIASLNVDHMNGYRVLSYENALPPAS